MPKVVFDPERCKGCRLCVEVCPKGVLDMAGVRNRKGYFPAQASKMDACTGCTFCALICPDHVIEVFREERGKKNE